MTKHTIKLPLGEWEYDDSSPLGPAGGFGEVFRGHGQTGDVAIKRLKLSAQQAAHRELKVGQELMARELTHVVPILDAGQDAESDRYFLVMPICDRSLQDEIDRSNGGVDIVILKEAIMAIISGLGEVGDIVHRDLKPSNILHHDGVWKIADFGIAKFVEDSTSLETLRGILTPAYAAPEQWLGERPTVATDVYAVGCIIHALAKGEPPFGGAFHTIREQHLRNVPEQIVTLPPVISAFVSHMLRKPPAARPSLERCWRVLSDIPLEHKGGRRAQGVLEEAIAEVAEREAREEAEREVAEAAHRKRKELFSDANHCVLSIRDRLFEEIQKSTESAKIKNFDILNFGYARLRLIIGPEMLIEPPSLKSNNASSRIRWDIIAWAIIQVESKNYKWSASLLFADRKDGNGFRWYEIAFWNIRGSDSNEPYGIPGNDPNLELVLSNELPVVRVAYGPFPIDGEDEESFIDRWTELVAKAAMGRLSRPNQMPIPNFK